MKKQISLFSILLFAAIISKAQFKQSMGPTLSMDNSIGAILMDLSTSNKEALMKGEQSSIDTLDRFYPNRIFGANTVYIKANYDIISYTTNTFDATTKGQIMAAFTPTGTDLIEPLKALKTNLEASKVFQLFFEKDVKNKDLNKIMYVQKAAFQLPPTVKLPPTQLLEMNKGLKTNFDKYEIKMCIETPSVTYAGTTVDYIRIRSWVQIKESFLSKEKAASIKNNEAVKALEKKEMQNVHDIETGIVKPNKPGIKVEDDEAAMEFFSKRHSMLLANYETLLKNYTVASETDKAKNKQTALKAAKEAFKAVHTNHQQWENYTEKAILKRAQQANSRIEPTDMKTYWKGRIAEDFYTLPIFKQLVETFNLK